MARTLKKSKETPPGDASLGLIEAAFPDARSSAKREVLSHALAAFNETGLEAGTIDELRRRSGQATGTIYHHFKNKEGVVAALFFVGLEDQSRAIAAALAEADGTVRQMVAALIRAYLDWAQRHAALARFLMLAREVVAKGPGGELLAEHLRARYQPLDDGLARAMDEGVIVRVPEELVPSLVLGPAEAYCRAWLAGRRATPPGEFAPALADAAWRSLSVS